MIERDVMQLQYMSGVVRNVLAVGFAPHVAFCHHGIRLDLVAGVHEMLASCVL